MNLTKAFVPKREYSQLSEIATQLKLGLAAAATREPTDGQATSGNYPKGSFRMWGHRFVVETPMGVARRFHDIPMPASYGYVARTEGADGDHVDVFFGPGLDSSETVYVIDQLKRDRKEFDEHKVMLGFPSKQSAEDTYLRAYPPGWTGIGAITEMSKKEFRDWLDSGDKKPLQWRKPRIAIDMDGTLLEYDRWRGEDHFGEPIPGAREWVEGLRADGWYVIIHTTRVTTDPVVGSARTPAKSAKRVGEALDAAGIPYDEVWSRSGKPMASAYCDDKAVLVRPTEIGYEHANRQIAWQRSD